jgi:hypothetical protein
MDFETLCTAVKTLSVKERAKLASICVLSEKSKKGKKGDSSDSETEKVKKPTSEGQNAWFASCRRTTDVIQKAFPEDKFIYKQGMQVAGMIKDKKIESPSDSDILSIYETWKVSPPAPKEKKEKAVKEKKEKPAAKASSSSSSASSASSASSSSSSSDSEEAPAAAAPAAAEAPAAPAAAAKPKKPAQKKTAIVWSREGESGGLVTIKGTEYRWDDDAEGKKFLWLASNTEFVGAWQESSNSIDLTATEPACEMDE